MRVLVTGASGYIGRAVVRELVATGHLPRLLLHSARVAVPEGTETVRGDVLDRDGLIRAVEGVDAVVHLAARAGVRSSFQQSQRFHELNVGGTVNLLDALQTGRSGSVRLVFASTASVYGAPSQQPIGEAARPAPASPYASSKLEAEEAIVRAVEAGTIGASTLRIFNAAGAVDGHGDPDDSRIIPRAVGVAAGRIPSMELYGDGSAVRDFVHVKDIASACVAALEHCRPGRYEVFNVGATSASLCRVIDTVCRVSRRPVNLVRRPANPREVREVRADTSHLEESLGWKAVHSSLEEMVGDQWDAEYGWHSQDS
jgi:UDP-glucose 4-epimerase